MALSRDTKKWIGVVLTFSMAVSLGPLFAAPGNYKSPKINSAGMVDPYVPVDGVMNVTGALVLTSSLTLTGDMVCSDDIIADAATFSGDVTFNGTTGALGFASGETLVPADAVLNVTGGVTVSGGFIASAGDTAYSGTYGIYDTASATRVLSTPNGTANPVEIRGSVANGATAKGIRLSTGVDLATAGGIIVEIGDNAGSSFARKAAFMLDGAALFTPTALALSGAHTALPVGGIVEVTCTGAQTWTPTETSATNGEIHHIVNVGADALTMDHVAGQVLLNGGADVVLGQNDAMTIYYSTAASAWVQLGATSNN